MLTYLQWRASFYFIAIIFAVFFLHALWAVPSVEAFEPGEPLKQRLYTFARKFDALGAALILFGTGMFTAGITLGPEEGWTSPITLSLILIGVALVVIFGWWETRCAHPLMPPFIWKDRNFTLLSKCLLMSEYDKQSADDKSNRCDDCIRIHVLPSIIILPGILHARNPRI